MINNKMLLQAIIIGDMTKTWCEMPRLSVRCLIAPRHTSMHGSEDGVGAIRRPTRARLVLILTSIEEILTKALRLHHWNRPRR